MAEKEQPTQFTPKGLEIPVPDRKTVDDALTAIAKPQVDPKTAGKSRGRKRGTGKQ
jgi:hypothetical protein